jgi:hypothetical protein
MEGEHTMRQRSLLLLLALGVLAFVMQAAWAQDAHGNHDAYMFLVGVPPVEGPDAATAPNGSTVRLSGAGSFKAGPDKTASGGGSYTITDSAGNMVAAGSWTAIAVLGFVDYGDGTPQGAPATFHGGEAHLRVSLSGIGEGVLTIECLFGSPPAGKQEGSRLVLGQGLNFNKSTSGQTLFIKP